MTTPNAAFWDGIADNYAKKPVDDPDAFERKIAITKGRMTPSDVVLDIGCGTGSLALRLAAAGAEIHGLDVSKEMLRIANEKAERQGVSNVVFHEGPFDERFTVLADESLDGVCAYSILHLVEDPAAALRQIYRLLKPGGFFISSTVCLGNSWFPFRPVIAVMRWLGKAPMVKILSTPQIKTEIEQAGFVDVDTPDVGAKKIVAFVVGKKPE